MEHYNNVEADRECNDSNKTISGPELLMTTNGRYRHTYTATASDITPLYRLTPNAMLMYFQDSFATDDHSQSSCFRHRETKPNVGYHRGAN